MKRVPPFYLQILSDVYIDEEGIWWGDKDYWNGEAPEKPFRIVPNPWNWMFDFVRFLRTGKGGMK